MSHLWNGRPMSERGDTPASRCMDIIERGMRRLRLERAPAEFNQLLSAKVVEHVSRAVRPDAELLEHWHALPPKKRMIMSVSRELRVSDTRLRKVLAAAGVRGVSPPPAKMPRAVREAVLRTWNATPAEQRNVAALARAHGLSVPSLRVMLAKAGVYHVQPPTALAA